MTVFYQLPYILKSRTEFQKLPLPTNVGAYIIRIYSGKRQKENIINAIWKLVLNVKQLVRVCFLSEAAEQTQPTFQHSFIFQRSRSFIWTQYRKIVWKKLIYSI